MNEITYYADKEGNWTKVAWRKQCPKKILFGRCQGTKGHEGDHWCYSPNGNYNYSVQGKLKPHEICGGIIPPNSDNWINPKDMQSKYYMKFYESSKVTDPKLISRLNQGKIKKNEIINRPVDLDKMNE